MRYSTVIDRFIPLLLIVSVLGSCAYYNTFYNAEEYFAEAQRVTRENQSEVISREEINLYSKSIEKSKKLLQRYPDSKYRDDAQFLIAKSYYYKGDYLIAKRYFDDLALEYGNSPHVDEVPLWIGRCLLQVGDLEMARHEASRILKERTSRSLQADALLLMGEVAVRQDSLLKAEGYLEQVIKTSPDGFTKAQAQFQIGRMRENKFDYAGALDAYRSVSRYRPSESLKVEAIIRQTSMLKALERDEDAIEMILEMLESDKFVDIRGQLEVELGKLYLATGDKERAESKFLSILEDYSRQEVAAEASYYLGELHLIENLNYKGAREAYTGIKTQSMRSPFVNRGAQRLKQIDRYVTLQTDFTNLERQLAGKPPIVKKKATTTSRNARTARSRGRGRTNAKLAAADDVARPPGQTKAKAGEETLLEVSAEDSLKFLQQMDENRYGLAEYLLFEFSRVDSCITLLDSLESTSQDSSMKEQSAYMRYYALDNVKGDSLAGVRAMEHIAQNYPEFYDSIYDTAEEIIEDEDPNEAGYLAIAELFEKGDLRDASRAYQSLSADSTVSPTIRAKASFNAAWLNDHYLFDREGAMAGYEFVVSNFSSDPLSETAQNRLRILKKEPAKEVEPTEGTDSQDVPQESEEEAPESVQKQVKGPKQGEKDKGRR